MSAIEQIGRYKIIDVMGPGSLGEVYRARDTERGRTVAVTIVRADIAADAAAREAFLRAAGTAATISHPNVAACEDSGEEAGRLYLAAEYAAGDTLATLLAGRPMGPRRALDVAIQIADALADIHASGLVQRRLTPTDVVVTPKGAVKLLDVGFADWLPAPAEAYLSPEGSRGEPIDHRADLYSLGTILREMLTGRPSPGDSWPTDVSKSLVPIVSKMTARTVAARYDSAATVAADLRAVRATLDERVQPGPEPVAPPARRTSALAWIAAVVVLATIGTLVWLATRVD